MLPNRQHTSYKPEYWGGIECTINRVNDRFLDQLHFAGHYHRGDDIDRIAELGITKLRYPVLWEKHQPVYDVVPEWGYTVKRLEQIRKHNIVPIAGLLHHGSGPSFTNLADDNFPTLFAAYASAVARKFPFLEYYTPINEPLTTARFSGLYGLWYPHKKNDASFAKMLLNQAKGIILAMQEIRKINPGAKLVQTEDLSKTYSTPSLNYQARFENERRWLTYDLLCGKIQPGHAIWDYFMRLGIPESTLNFFVENATYPDVMGCNYYITSERFLDDRLDKYPAHLHGGNEIQEYADVEAIRISHGNPCGLTLILKEAWARYQLPLAITEVHLNAGREDQLRWLHEIISSCREAAKSGVDVRAITFWSLLGAYGWNNLLTSESMDYEPGAFDLRSTPPRSTAIAGYIKNITRGENDCHVLSQQQGWWCKSNRFHTKEKVNNSEGDCTEEKKNIVITGKTGTLGNAFARICGERNIDYLLTGREVLDITNKENIHCFLDANKPWAIINTAGYVRVDEAESDKHSCFEINTLGPALLAKACRERNIAFATFSSDLVFDGKKNVLYCENDKVNPLNVYGHSKALAEEKVLAQNPSALIVRTSAFFGPWDRYNFAHSVLKTLSRGEKFVASSDVFISPTYLPHLVHTVIDLLIDGEKGIWHLCNKGAVSWKDFAVQIAEGAGYHGRMIEAVEQKDLNLPAKRPGYSALASGRGALLPSLDDAITCFFKECNSLPTNTKMFIEKNVI